MSYGFLSCLSAGCLLLSITALPLYAQATKASKIKGEVPDNTKNEAKPQLSPLYINTHILVAKGKHTILPKGSIIYLPAKDKSKVSKAPSGKFVFWPDFHKKNRNWIWTYEVNIEQAKGLKPILPSKLEEFAKLGRMVVATYQKSPISVMPPPEPSKDKK